LSLNDKALIKFSSNVEDDKIENFNAKINFKIDLVQRHNRLKLLKENIQSKKNLIEKNIDLAATLPKLDFKTNEKNQIKINDPEFFEEHNLQENIKMDHLISLNRILSAEKENNKIQRIKNNEKNYSETDENEIFNITNNQNIKENFTRCDNKIFSSEINQDYEKPNNQGEIFEKVLDNIKYKKKKKNTRKSSVVEEDDNSKVKNFGKNKNHSKSKNCNKMNFLNENSINTDNSIRLSNDRKTVYLNLELQKSNTDNMRCGLSTNIPSERNSENINNVNKSNCNNDLKNNVNSKKNIFKNILKGVNEETDIIRNNYYSNNKTEAYDENNNFNLFGNLESALSHNEEDNNNQISCKRDSGILNAFNKNNEKICKNNSSNLISYLLNNDNSSIQNKNDNYERESIYDCNNKNVSSILEKKLKINKKEEIKKNIEKEKIKNANIFHLNFDKINTNNEISNLNTENSNNFKNIRLNIYEKIKIEKNKKKNNKYCQSSNSNGIFRMRKNNNLDKVNSTSSRSICFNQGNINKNSYENEKSNLIFQNDPRKTSDLNKSYVDSDKNRLQFFIFFKRLNKQFKNV